MNNNEFKLREITVTLAVLNQKDSLNKAEKELFKHLEKERELLLNQTDAK